MNLYLSPSAYNDTKQLECNYYNCTKGKYFIQKTFTALHHTKWSCPFTQSMLGACSGLEDPTFGYNSTMPCVVIKMNRVCFGTFRKHVFTVKKKSHLIIVTKENILFHHCRSLTFCLLITLNFLHMSTALYWWATTAYIDCNNMNSSQWA